MKRERAAAGVAAALLVGSCLLFALVGVTVKWLSPEFPAGEIVLYRSAVGLVCIAAYARWAGVPLATRVPMLHLRRSAAGVLALAAWFHAITALPLATAMTLNASSSVWLALTLCAAALLWRRAPVDLRLLGSVLVGFVGVACVLRPEFGQAPWHAVGAGLASGMLAAAAYLQLIALSRAGEPDERIVFYFCIGGVALGAALTMAAGGPTPLSPRSLALLLANGVLATVAQWMMTRAFAIGRPLANATLQYSGIVFSYLLGVALFSDRLSAVALAGIVLIVGAGIVATTLRSTPSWSTER